MRSKITTEIIKQETSTMQYKFIQNSIELLRSVTDFDEREFRGCSEAQIETLEALLPKYSYFPDSYYEFLNFGGNGISNMLNSTNFYFPQIYNLQKEGRLQKLKDEDFFSKNFKYDLYWTSDLFLFYFHQGYFARFFYLNSGDDPEVFYSEAGLNYSFLPTQEQSFSEYFYSEVENFIACYQEKILTVAPELQHRVKNYRCHILNILDTLEVLSVSQELGLIEYAKMRYNDVFQNLYHIFDYAYYELYESSYLFSPNKILNSPELITDKLQELIETMYSLEKEGKELVSFVKKLKGH